MGRIYLRTHISGNKIHAQHHYDCNVVKRNKSQRVPMFQMQPEYF